MINVEAYRNKCNSVLDYYHANPLLSWNVHSPSVLYSDFIAHVYILIHFNNSILIYLMILHRFIFFIIILQTLSSISNRLDSQSLKHRKKACIKKIVFVHLMAAKNP